MSKSRVAGIVCEGHTDVPILEAIVSKLWPEIDDVRVLQPQLDALGKVNRTGRSGWSEVRAWCEQNASRLDEIIYPDVGDTLDLLLIVVDLDIAIEAKIADPPKVLGSYATKRLCDTIKGWLRFPGRTKLPPEVVIAIPAMSIETWIIAALFKTELSPESIADPAGLLVERKKLQVSPRGGKPWKYLPRYREEFSARVATRLNAVRKVCPEAERTSRKIEQRRDLVESSA